MLKEIQVYDVCGLSSSTSWPQDKDASPSKLFGRWLQEAWTGQWRSETGKGRQPIKGELSNSLYSGQLKLHPTGALWETGWYIPQNYSNRGVRELWYLPTSSHLSVCEGSSPWGCYVLSTCASPSMVERAPEQWSEDTLRHSCSWKLSVGMPGGTWAPAPAMTLRLWFSGQTLHIYTTNYKINPFTHRSCLA